MANINDGVGKKIVEALKKQSEGELNSSETQVQKDTDCDNGLGIDVSALDSMTVSDLNALNISEDYSSNQIPEFDEIFDDSKLNASSFQGNSFAEFLDQPSRAEEPSGMPTNILILKKLISQLPNGVTRQTGAQIIKQTMEALGISMKSVLTEAQEVQGNLQVSSKECQMLIQDYKRKIVGLEKQVQNYQKQYNALNDLISLFIQTTK